MKTTFNPIIANDDDFAAAIDALGAKLEEIARLEKEAAPCKDLIKAYALAKKISTRKTALYRFRLAKSAGALKPQKEVKKADVVQLMRANPLGKEFLMTIYDADAIKAAYEAKALGEDQLALFGLEFTAPRQSVEVKPR